MVAQICLETPERIWISFSLRHASFQWLLIAFWTTLDPSTNNPPLDCFLLLLFCPLLFSALLLSLTVFYFDTDVFFRHCLSHVYSSLSSYYHHIDINVGFVINKQTKYNHHVWKINNIKKSKFRSRPDCCVIFCVCRLSLVDSNIRFIGSSDNSKSGVIGDIRKWKEKKKIELENQTFCALLFNYQIQV